MLSKLHGGPIGQDIAVLSAIIQTLTNAFIRPLKLRLDREA